MLIFSFSLQHSAKVLCSGQGIFASSFVHASTLEQLHISALDNMLLISQTIKQILLSRDTVIFLHPYNFEFVLNLKKSIVNPSLKSSDTIQSNKTVRSFWFNNSGSVASSGKFLIFLATTNKNIKNNSMRRYYCKNSFELSSDGITEQ